VKSARHGARGVRDIAALAVRHVLAAWSGASGRSARALGRQRGAVPVLMYHRILSDGADASGIEPGMFVRASAFGHQVEWLVSRWSVRTLRQALDSPPSHDDEPFAVITFDDGWRDNLTVAWPILERHGARATIFLVRDWVRDGRGEDGEFLRPRDVSMLAAQGMDFGAHTVTHPRLDGLDAAAIESEMRASKDAVEAWTGRECETFAYPFGVSSPRAEDAARRLFRCAVITRGGWWRPGHDPARLPRVAMHHDMTSTRWMFESRLAAGD